MYGLRIIEESGVVGSGAGMSNNVAEYSGLAAALTALLRLPGIGTADVAVKSDSMMLVNQMGGSWRTKGGMYMLMYEKSRRLEAELKHKGAKITYTWIPREQNQEADALSKRLIPR